MSQEETVGVDSTYHPTYLGADTQAYEEWCCTLAAARDKERRAVELIVMKASSPSRGGGVGVTVRILWRGRAGNGLP